MDPYPDSDPDPDADADLDPAFFVTDIQDANKKLIFFKVFCLLLFEGTFTSVSKDKKSQYSKNQGFPYYFCMVMKDPDLNL